MTNERSKTYILGKLNEQLQEWYPNDKPVYTTDCLPYQILAEEENQFKVVADFGDKREVHFNVPKDAEVTGYILPSELPNSTNGR